MKRTQRRTRATESSSTRKPNQTGGRGRPGRRGKPRKFSVENSSSSTSERSFQDDIDEEGVNALGHGTENSRKHTHATKKQKGNFRLTTAFCRLCHGKFSIRRLRHAFDKEFGNDMDVDVLDLEMLKAPLLFCSDFQRLLGVPMNRDPHLSPFICKTCHGQFYKCHRILAEFRKKVNHTPASHDGKRGSSESVPAADGASSGTAITSDPKCLHSLVSWAHHHGEACRSCPNLKEVLEGQCWGSVKAVWGCVDGHSYVLDSDDSQATANSSHVSAAEGGKPGKDGSHHRASRTPRKTGNAATASSTVQPSPVTTPQTQQHSNQGNISSPSTDGLFPNEEMSSLVAAQPTENTADSDLSDRNFSSDEEYGDGRKCASSDEQADTYTPKQPVPSKKRSKVPKPPPQPKERKKPGPKKKPKSEREELPNIYKCPYQGCTAVYRGSDGMKKHIKEHHEEVRERPCPHPGCNKVFMIDRYLQRHVKLIHTEERNYICDQCGQTFKQRKHLSVHQMRHSGAKPLQCEVCGFQCRQRASLKYHMTKHKAEAELDFACNMCSKRFEKAHNLNVHMSMVHPLTQASPNDAPAPVPVPAPTSDLDMSRQASLSTETPLQTQLQGFNTVPVSQDTSRTIVSGSEMNFMLESL